MSEDTKINWKESFKSYIKNNFSVKNNIIRLTIFLLCCFVVILSTMLMRNFALTLEYGKQYGDGFISIELAFNEGMAFGTGSYVVAYVMQSIICLIMLLIIVFTNKWYYILLLSLAFFGGLSNIIDRAIPDNVGGQIYFNQVVDYFKFSFDWGIFNLADVYVCVGSIVAAILLIIELIVSSIKEYKNDKSKK